MTRALPALALAACSGRADAPSPGSASPPAPPPVVAPADAAAATQAGSGDLEVRVEWPGVAASRRASPGRTACGTARPGEVAPSTTWGIPDVVVLVDAGAPAGSGDAPRVVARACELAPRAQVAAAGAGLAIASASEAPVALALVRLAGSAAPAELAAAAAPGPTAGSDAALAAVGGLAVELPVIGHEVVAPLAAPAVAAVAWRDGSGDAAWVVAWPHAAAVTDRSGRAVLRGLPAGRRDIVAWLPARAGFPAEVARATATVASGELAEATLAFGSAAPTTAAPGNPAPP